MFWSLESLENGIFLLINGLRVLDFNGIVFGFIEIVKLGRNVIEIWVSNKYFEQFIEKIFFIIIEVQYMGIVLIYIGFNVL